MNDAPAAFLKALDNEAFYGQVGHLTYQPSSRPIPEPYAVGFACSAKNVVSRVIVILCPVMPRRIAVSANHLSDGAHVLFSLVSFAKLQPAGVRMFQFDQIVELADGPRLLGFRVGQLDPKGSLDVVDDVHVIAVANEVQRIFHVLAN
jgi:hypothetical protein